MRFRTRALSTNLAPLVRADCRQMSSCPDTAPIREPEVPEPCNETSEPPPPPPPECTDTSEEQPAVWSTCPDQTTQHCQDASRARTAGALKRAIRGQMTKAARRSAAKKSAGGKAGAKQAAARKRAAKRTAAKKGAAARPDRGRR